MRSILEAAALTDTIPEVTEVMGKNYKSRKTDARHCRS
jgi:hypothetical protein